MRTIELVNKREGYRLVVQVADDVDTTSDFEATADGTTFLVVRDAWVDAMTFEEFQATRKEVDDVEAATNGDYPTDGKRAGFVYAGGFVIEETADGAYALYIENCQSFNIYLKPLEIELFDFVVSLGN